MAAFVKGIQLDIQFKGCTINDLSQRRSSKYSAAIYFLIVLGCTAGQLNKIGNRGNNK